MLEVLSPAGSWDALVAAVQNGADAVYLGYGSFNARMNAKNFSEDQLRQSVIYCHTRGVKVYLTLNTLVSDRELKAASEVALLAARVGVDAILVQDFGVCRMVHELIPEMPIHASTQMAVHNLAGVLKAAEMGITRVVLARELSRSQIASICRQSPVEIEVFVHGALCMCYSGQCYMSAMIGRRSGNRGQCAQPCRMVYGYDRPENRYPLSLKDNCLITHLQELEAIGVACVKIEGRMKRAEYVAIATRLYKNAVQGKPVSAEDLKDLAKAFSRQGFTDAYYRGKKGQDMFGIRGDEDTDRTLMAKARATYESGELQRVPLRAEVQIRYGVPAELKITDDIGNTVTVQGDVPEIALRTPITEESLAARLAKTGGTPYYIDSVQSYIEPGLILSASQINNMRRDALAQLTADRGRVKTIQEYPFRQPPVVKGRKGKPVYTVQIQNLDQITSGIIALKPAVIYVPLHLLRPDSEMAVTLCQAFRVCAVLPRVVQEPEWENVFRMLAEAKRIGVEEVLIGNIGMIEPMREAGMTIRGDFGFNVFNSGDTEYLAEQGLKSVTASFELTLPQIRDLSKPLPMEMIAYGRLPLMITENCIIHNRSGSCICSDTTTSLVDRTGSRFPLMRDGLNCRTQILNSRKLYLGDKLQTLGNMGLWGLRLSFTTENSKQVDMVIDDFRHENAFDPGTCTRGLYGRGVE